MKIFYHACSKSFATPVLFKDSASAESYTLRNLFPAVAEILQLFEENDMDDQLKITWKSCMSEFKKLKLL